MLYHFFKKKIHEHHKLEKVNSNLKITLTIPCQLSLITFFTKGVISFTNLTCLSSSLPT
jgi:hypothetical protein